MGHYKLEQNPQRRSCHVFPAYGTAGACLKETTPWTSSVSHGPSPSLGNTRIASWWRRLYMETPLFSLMGGGMGQGESFQSDINIQFQKSVSWAAWLALIGLYQTQSIPSGGNTGFLKGTKSPPSNFTVRENFKNNSLWKSPLWF